jgi:LAO/AO transport system kinase
MRRGRTDPPSAGDLVEAFRSGSVRALARAITLVERRDPSVRQLQDALRDRHRAPRVLGWTGAPGTGKSTLVDWAISHLRERQQKVAVIAVDPNSPYSGGAILGDRIRMQRHAGDRDVFIRSMGTRGHLGGLSMATREAVRLLGAFGFDWVLLETVGVGQSELEVAAIADTTLVVLTPGLGDGVQMIKAGIMEVADAFVVNKADMVGARKTVQEIKSMLHMGPALAWTPPVVSTVATQWEGLEELFEQVERHRLYLEESGEGRRRAEARLKEEAADLVGEWAREQARQMLDEEDLADRLLGDGSPYAAAEEILARRGKALVPEAARRED